jgi:hypothetical protein
MSIDADFNNIPKEIREQMGAWKTVNGLCPIDAMNPVACMLCPFGHATECHYPHTCEEVECSHYQQEMEEEW